MIKDQLQVVQGLKVGEKVAVEIMRLRPDLTVAPRLVQLDESGSLIEDAEPAKAGASPGDESAEGEAGA